MVDVANPAGVITVDDFEFRAGNDNDPTGWTPVTAMPGVEVRPGEGTTGADRVVLIWPDNAIQKQWLEVTVLATGNTGLADPDVFYFGNAIGETGNSTSNALVDVQDVLATHNNPHPFWDPAEIDNLYDFNRDQRVDVVDVLIAQDNQTWSFTALELIDLSGAKAGSSQDLWGNMSVHDAVIEQAARRQSSSRETSSARMTWLYEFEQPNPKERSSTSGSAVERAVDALLAIDSA
jgi:hypothetical protein